MSKEILDVYIEQGYEYVFDINLNDVDNNDLEGGYECYFESNSIGKKQYTVVNNMFRLTLSESDTSKLTTNLEKYNIYAKKISTGKYDKLLSGRMHIDFKGQ